MVCPRCARVRIERDGVLVRCAVCGMTYNPSQDLTIPASEHGAAVPEWFAAAFVPESQAVVERNAGYVRS